MPLADDQKLLTRLLTDRSLLEEFLNDPIRAAENAGFPRESALRLAQIPSEHLRGSGRSLIQKRASAVAKILSQTHKALGHEAFQRRFREYAEHNWPTGPKRHRDDAIGFGDFLRRQRQEIPSWIRDLASWETAVLAIASSSRRIVARKLGHHPAALREAVVEQHPPHERATFLIGLRLPFMKRVRWLAVPLAFGRRDETPRGH